MQQQQRQQQVAAIQASLTSREASFAQAAWEAGIRPDSRKFNQIRECKFDFPAPERGICAVELGKTQVVAKVSCNLVDPLPFSPKSGFLDFNVICNASVTEAAVSLAAASRTATTTDVARTLELLFKTNKAIDTESLCVLPGRKVWSITVDVTVLNDAGNITDASVWATACALQHFRRPELTILNDQVTIHPPHERDPVSLNIHHVPLTLTSILTGAIGSATSRFGAFVIDPSPAEVLGGSGALTVAVNRELHVCSVHKSDGEDTTYSVIKQVLATAKGLAPQLFELMDAARAADEKLRKDATLAQFSWAQKRTGVAAIAPAPAAAASGEGSEALDAKKPRKE